MSEVLARIDRRNEIRIDLAEENHSNGVTHCVLVEKTVDVEDDCDEDGFDFTGTGANRDYRCYIRSTNH